MATKYVAPEGFYHNALGIFKVVTNQASGHRYAKKLHIQDGKASWEFAKGAVAKLQPNTKLTEEAAAQFGSLYGQCICCLKTLDNEESIKYGIGPICRAKYF